MPHRKVTTPNNMGLPCDDGRASPCAVTMSNDVRSLIDESIENLLAFS